MRGIDHAVVVTLSLLLTSTALPAQDEETAVAAVEQDGFRRDMVNELAWRNLGPANPVGRVTDIEIPADDHSTWYVGTAGGGVWKTSNAGTTWTNIFDKLGNVSIGDVATAPSNPDVVWVGTGEENGRNSVQWGNGIYKSTDGGESWEFAGLPESFQIGHIAIHPTDPDIVYVAALGRLWGDNEERGVYRTTDGGKNWERVLFLDERTGCIDVRIDPSQPETLYACMYERQRDEFDGNDPAVRFGDNAGLFRSTDGGDNWQELTQDLPGCKWGRSGIDIFPEDPNTLFLIVETERSGWAMGDRKDRMDGDPTPPADEEGRGRQRRGPPRRLPRGSAVLGVGEEGSDGPDGTGAILAQVSEDGAAGSAGLAVGDRITSIDDEEVKTYADLKEIESDSRGGQEIDVVYIREGEETEVQITLGTRESSFGGMGPSNGPYGGRLNGQQANRQKYQGDLGYECGGIFRSDDRGETWRRINSLTERPFYYSVIRVDPSSLDHIYSVGTSMWATEDGGEKFESINRDIHVDFHAFWVDPDDGRHLIAGCDGGVNESFDRGRTWQVHRGFCAAQYYDVTADNSVPYNVIGGLQDNGTWVGPSRTRNREGITLDDWVTIYGGDGFGAVADPVEPWIVFATSQNGALGMVDLRTRSQIRIQKQRPEEGRARSNWAAPFLLSPHNRLTLYTAGEFVYRADRYAHLDNRANRSDQGPVGRRGGSGAGFGQRGGGGRGGRGGGRGSAASLSADIVSPRLGRTEKGTAVALAESPRVRGLLYVGTDDGALWRGEVGGEWTPLHDNLPAMPGPRYVSDIVASHHRNDRVYITLDGHRSDDFRTYVFISEDRGETWSTLATNLPSNEPCYAFVEDPRRADLLFLGTEYGCHVSLDRGTNWFAMGKDMPTVSVRDLFLQDRDSDLVAGTHGRGVWVVDIAPLRDLSAEIAEEDFHLFRPADAILWRMTSRGYSGNRYYRAANPAYGTSIYLYLAADQEEPPVVTIHDITGKEIAKLEGREHRGIQRLQWDARQGNRLATPGTYSARIEVGEEQQARAFQLHADPGPQPYDNPTTEAQRR